MQADLTPLPLLPLRDLTQWATCLRQVASQPLEFCPHFPTIAQRFEAWWAHDCIDRPVFIGAANGNPARPITRRLELLDQPDEWFAAKLQDLRQVHRVGDTLPTIRTDFGAVLLGGLVGGRVEIGADTTWTHAFINDSWSNAPDWQIRDDNPLWLRLKQLTSMVAADCPGRYLLCTPDLGGSADVLLNLRGSSELCLDAVEQPERIRESIDALYPAWHRAFAESYRLGTAHGGGLVHWLQIWSNQPYMIPACDFNFLIGPSEFERLCLPDIARQAATVGRAVFHLDGPGAARHIDALLEVPEIQAIQFTPGEGTPSALAWIEMFRKIQNRGRSLYIITPAEEVLTLRESLRPEGVALALLHAPPPAELDQLFALLCRNTKRC
jgi:hypothetical protein